MLLFLTNTRGLQPFRNIRKGCTARPVSYSISNEVAFFGGKATEVWSCSRLCGVEFNNVWKYTSTPPYAFILGTAEDLLVLNNSTWAFEVCFCFCSKSSKCLNRYFVNKKMTVSVVKRSLRKVSSAFRSNSHKNICPTVESKSTFPTKCKSASL